MMRPTVNGANPFSTAILHFDFCAFCQNSVTTYISDAAGTIIATVAITPPRIAPGTPPTVSPAPRKSATFPMPIASDSGAAAPRLPTKRISFPKSAPAASLRWNSLPAI